LAGLIGTQLIYVGAVVMMVVLAKIFPGYFLTTLTTRTVLFVKLPIALAIIGLTVYPLVVWLVARWFRRRDAKPSLPA
jgi:hypothetical protein